MASQSTGIQQLLQAEKKAAEKVSEARKRKIYQGLLFDSVKTPVKVSLQYFVDGSV